MAPAALSGGDGDAARARAWHHAAQAAVCDVLEPWAHGTVVRATRYPGYYDYNLVRVEDDPRMSVEALASFADAALAGLEHRRLDFDVAAAAEPLRADFEARGWSAMRLLWMRHDASTRQAATAAVTEVPYDAVAELRAVWHQEDFPGQDADAYHAQAREVALRLRAQVFALLEDDVPVAFAQLERADRAAEITQVFVHPRHRGDGRGTAITSAAIEAAGDVRDLWICADDEARPKQLYARLGFRPAWTTMELQLAP